MKRGIILYRSKYGAAKRYANWLAQATGFDCVEIGKADIDAVRQVPAVILCGGIYAGGIGGIGWIQAHWQALQGCKLAVFAVGASPWDADALRELRARNLKPPMEKIPCFYGRGAWDESVMGFRDRVLVKLLKKMTAKQDPAGYEPWQAALMSAGAGPADWTDRAYLRPLLDAIENGWQSPE
ncbi:MAG TPA: flavodoxin [Candidatus Faecousia gallistercoris]|nr:flavodoxin [Candidatus Faecousia gallistercoris]